MCCSKFSFSYQVFAAILGATFFIGLLVPFQSSEQAVSAGFLQEDLRPLEQKIRALHGQIEYEGEGANRTVSAITFLFNAIKDDDLKTLSSFPKLKRIEFQSNLGITTAGLSHLVNCQSLETLNLFGTGAGDDALIPISKLPRLKELQLYRTNVTDKGIESLIQSQTLEIINIWDTETTVKSLDALAKIKTLRKICVGNSPQPFGDQSERSFEFRTSSISRSDIEATLRTRPDLEFSFWDPAVPENPITIKSEPVTKKADSQTKLAAKLSPKRKPERTNKPTET